MLCVPWGREGGCWDGAHTGGFMSTWELGEGWGGLRGPLQLHLQMWVCQETRQMKVFLVAETTHTKAKLGETAGLWRTADGVYYGLSLCPPHIQMFSADPLCDGIRR